MYGGIHKSTYVLQALRRTIVVSLHALRRLSNGLSILKWSPDRGWQCVCSNQPGSGALWLHSVYLINIHHQNNLPWRLQIFHNIYWYFFIFTSQITVIWDVGSFTKLKKNYLIDLSLDDCNEFDCYDCTYIYTICVSISIICAKTASSNHPLKRDVVMVIDLWSVAKALSFLQWQPHVQPAIMMTIFCRFRNKQHQWTSDDNVFHHSFGIIGTFPYLPHSLLQ